MCGRFSFGIKAPVLEERFGVFVDESELLPRYNCAPSQRLAVISNSDPTVLSYYRWGLIPAWAHDRKMGAHMINAKAETITEKPSFRQSFRKRRCLVPADSFYEWAHDVHKTPYRILMDDEQAFAMAGIWDAWIDEQGNELRSFSILTTMANETVAGIHHRMPVILSRDKEKVWLDNSPEALLLECLKPYEEKTMKKIPLGRMINNPANDSPEVQRAVVTGSSDYVGETRDEE